MTGPAGYNSDDEQRLRDALRREADQVIPSPDGLERIRARVHRPPWFRRPIALAVAGATATAGVVVAATLVFSSTSPSDDAAGGPSPTVDNTGTPQVTALPVYYAVHRPDGQVHLAREFHEPGTTQPIAAAITDMIRGAKDPDYDTLWRPKTEVNSAEVEDNDVIVVDLKNPGITDAAKGAERAAVQQLVYTATAAASSAYAEVERALPVQILVDGDTPPPKLRTQLKLRNLEKRVPEAKIRQLVQIDNPLHGTTWSGPVTIDGTASVFEGTLRWVITRNGTKVKADTVTAEECCRFSPFEFKVDLPPGTYEVAVSDTDPSEGEGPGVTTDTKTFRVAQ